MHDERPGGPGALRAEGEGFEPSRGLPLLDFESSALGRTMRSLRDEREASVGRRGGYGRRSLDRQPAGSAAGAEELAQQVAALLLAHPAHDLAAMVEPVVVEHVHQRPAAPALGSVAP